MPLPAIADAFKARISFRDGDGNIAVNVFHFIDQVGPLNTVRATALATKLATWVGTQWDAMACDDWECFRIEVVGIDEGPMPYVDYSMNNFGAVTGNPLPNNVTLAISLRTGYAGRAYRGRVFHVGLAESMVSINDVVAPWNADIPAAYYNLIGIAAGDDFTWGVASYFLDGQPRQFGIITPITNCVLVDNIVDTQRRRLPK